MISNSKKIILSSASPARLKLLEVAGFSVIVKPTDTEEILRYKDPIKAATDIAMQKMETYLRIHGKPTLPLLTVDTLISFKDRFIGKQADRESARTILSEFSDNTHFVHTGAVISLPNHNELITLTDHAEISFFSLKPHDIETYLDTEEWIGAAGAYRIQKTGISLVKSLDGDYYSVVGLPLMKIFGILRGQSY